MKRFTKNYGDYDISFDVDCPYFAKYRLFYEFPKIYEFTKQRYPRRITYHIGGIFLKIPTRNKTSSEKS